MHSPVSSKFICKVFISKLTARPVNKPLLVPLTLRNHQITATNMVFLFCSAHPTSSISRPISCDFSGY